MKFQIFQLFLILAVFVFGVYIYRLRTVLADRLILFLLTCAAVVFIIRPDITTHIANFLGIGRGADLVFYLFIIYCLFRFVEISSSIKSLEKDITRISREIAILNARDERETKDNVTDK